MDRSTDLGTLLGVWAHPDDETFLTAGLMAANRRLGNRVVCVTATRGELGVQDESRWPASELGAIREAELITSLEVLGVHEHIWLDYRDGSCAEVPEQEGIDRVATLIEQVQPDNVITFGPDGMTGHPDHKAISAWTTAAFERVAPPGARLLYAAVTVEWGRRFLDMFKPFSVFPQDPPLYEPEDLALVFEVSDELMDLKMEAISKHESQVEHLLSAFGKDYFQQVHREETFRLAMVR